MCFAPSCLAFRPWIDLLCMPPVTVDVLAHAVKKTGAVPDTFGESQSPAIRTGTLLNAQCEAKGALSCGFALVRFTESHHKNAYGERGETTHTHIRVGGSLPLFREPPAKTTHTPCSSNGCVLWILCGESVAARSKDPPPKSKSEGQVGPEERTLHPPLSCNHSERSDCPQAYRMIRGHVV